jgi:hypothetical protein
MAGRRVSHYRVMGRDWCPWGMRICGTQPRAETAVATLDTIRGPKVPQATPSALAYSGDGRYLAFVQSWTVGIRDLQSGKKD